MFLHNCIDFRLHRLDLILQFCQFLHVVRVFIDIVLWGGLVRANLFFALVFVANDTRTFLDLRRPVTFGRPARHVADCTLDEVDLQHKLLQICLVLRLPELAEFVILAALQLSGRCLNHEFVLNHISDGLHLHHL